MARIFFALRPAAPAREALGRLATEVAAETGARRVPEAGLHLTLVFLGECDRMRVEEAARAASRVCVPSFEVALDRLGAFAKAGVAWAGCARPPRALQDLQSALASRLADAGFALEDRPYSPHLTLARHMRGKLAPRAIDPVTWQAGSFALLRSGGGAGRYETVAEWPLGER